MWLPWLHLAVNTCPPSISRTFRSAKQPLTCGRRCRRVAARHGAAMTPRPPPTLLLSIESLDARAAMQSLIEARALPILENDPTCRAASRAQLAGS